MIDSQFWRCLLAALFFVALHDAATLYLHDDLHFLPDEEHSRK